MANIRLIKNRTKAAKNISQITKAMELVAASKMKKAQMQAAAGKAYAEKIYEMVMRLAAKLDTGLHPLLSKPKVLTEKRLIVMVTTNRGLCGGLNTNLFRYFLHEYPTFKNHVYVTLGKKGAAYLVQAGGNLAADFSQNLPFVNSVPALTDLISDTYIKGEVDGVDLLYSEFISALKQIPSKKTILPLVLESTQAEVKPYKEESLEFLIEPSVGEVFETLLPHYLENQIRDALLQAEASEQSARMLAMRNATDNALSLMDELTLLYNKARQEKITYEISDMVTARLSVV